MWFHEAIRWSGLQKGQGYVLMHGVEEEVGIPSGWKRPGGLEGVKVDMTTFENGEELTRLVKAFLERIVRSKNDKG